MVKFSTEYKLKIVQEYLAGGYSLRNLAAKSNMPSRSSINTWVRTYQELGEAGLKIEAPEGPYSVQFKLDVLHFIQSTGTSYFDTAMKFNIHSPALIGIWKNALLKQGVKGLDKKFKELPSMPKKPTKLNEEQSSNNDLIQKLERENELLRLEIAYIKKLSAFRKNPNAYLEKHKQQWHTNSSTKDSN